MSQNAPNIIIRNATLEFDGNVLFNELNLTVAGGKCTCLLGPSGVGKTTLLKMIANLMTSSKDQYFRGDIYSDNHLPLSEQISYLAQTDLLLPWLSALDNALLGSRLRHDGSDILLKKAKTLFQQMNLTHIENKFPYQLSGGMRQRIALIRTLLEEKPIVLMDEPFSGLDAITRYELQTLTANLLKNRTVLLVTHEPLEALRLGDEIIVLSGFPASIHTIIYPKTSTPRDPSDQEIMHYQAELFHALTQAKEEFI